MSNISSRAARVPASPIRKLVPFADAAKKAGKKVYHINIGQPDIETPEYFWNAVKSYPGEVLAYGNAKGNPQYLEELEKYYQEVGIDVSRDEIIVTTGGSEAIVFAMMTICDPGDEIVVFEPFYTNYNGYAAMANVKLVPVTTDPQEGYHLPDEAMIKKAISKKTRALMICTPNNPTGTVFSREELDTIVKIANENDLFVISDEVYREFVYEGKQTSIMNIPGASERAILLDSISKRFSACGARLGCVVSKNSEIMDSIWRLAQARLCPPSLEQIGAAEVLKNVDEDYYESIKHEYKHRRDVAIEELEKIDGAFCIKPLGAFYLMVKFDIDDIEDFAKWMLTDFSDEGETTMIAPGPGFYATPGKGVHEARLAYVLQEKDLRRAIQILAKGIKEYNNR